MALITQRFKKLIRRKRQIFKKKPFMKGELSKEKEKEKEQPMCYTCKKSKHFKAKYPLLKKSFKKFKKKARMAIWSDDKDSSSDEELQ